jgi:hypothetical protein
VRELSHWTHRTTQANQWKEVISVAVLTISKPLNSAITLKTMPTAIQEYVALHAIATLPALPQAQPSTYTLNSTTPPELCTTIISPNNQNESSTPNELGVDDSSLCAVHVGAFSKMHRKWYSVRETLAILKKVRRRIEDDKVSMRTAAGLFYLSPSQITQWRKMEQQLT